jgi:Immunoglobulin-like domain of bacterial spore germination
VSEHTDLEDRLRTAVHAHASGVDPDERGSLDTIRTRVRTARHRRRALLAGTGIAAAAVVAVAALRLGDDGRVRTVDEPGPSTTAVEPPSTTTAPTTPGSSSTTVVPAPPVANLDQAMWPDPAGSARFADPVEAARSFVEGFFGIADAPLSEFRAGEPGAGEIDVFSRNEDGQVSERVATTLSLRQLDGEHWWVTAATSDSVRIESPQPLADVASPVSVDGRASGFEGTVIVRLRDRSGSYGELGEDFATAGSGETLEPFSVDVAFDQPTASHAVLVASTESGIRGTLADVTAFPVRFSADASNGPPTGSTAVTGTEFQYQPLWPFRTQAEADAWRQQNDAQGTQPWHVDAEQTALSFTTGYLGFGEIDRVVAKDIREREAWVSVGYAPGTGRLSTSAVIHLVRFGAGDGAPWEVVGTRDTDLTLETPSYGSGVSSPVTVGGRITGVDESLRIQVRQSSSEVPIGESCCLPAGGDNTPWQAKVSFSGATDPALTIVVSTGGHVQGIERFAVTGVRP